MEKGSPGPLYQKVRQRLREEIASGRLKEGDLIPSEQELARKYGVSQGTARKAVLDLTYQGIFYRKQGKGTFVVFDKASRGRYRNFRFVRGLDAELVNVNLGFVRIQVIPAQGEIAKFLNLGKGTKVIRLDRMGKVAGEHLIYTISYLPWHLYRGLEKATAEDFLKNTLWKMQEISYGVRVEKREEYVSAVPASAQMGKLLEVKLGSPLLRLEVKLTSFSGGIVEYRVSHCHQDHLRFYLRNQP